MSYLVKYLKLWGMGSITTDYTDYYRLHGYGIFYFYNNTKMFQIEYSPNLRWEVVIWWSKNAALPIVAANYIFDNKVKLENKPDIKDIHAMEELANEAIQISKDFFDLTSDKATKLRASTLLIPFWLLKYGKVKFVGCGWCKIWKRPLDTFDDALMKAGVKITQWEFKTFEVVDKPKKNIVLQEFSVTATESLITYLAFAGNFDYEINVYQVATEPHVKNLIDFLNNAGAEIKLDMDNIIRIKPWKINIKKSDPEFSRVNFRIVSDYIQAGTYFAVWAWADDSEIILKNIDVDDLTAIYSLSEKIWINFKVVDKHTLKVNSYNKKNYKSAKIETRIFPWFPTDLQSIFGTLATQCSGVCKIFETLFEWRFGYLTELENLGWKTEILNPHEAIVIWPCELKWWYVSSTDLRWWGAMVLAWIMAKWTTNIMNEDIILRWYENIVENLKKIWVKIKQVS